MLDDQWHKVCRVRSSKNWQVIDSWCARRTLRCLIRKMIKSCSPGVNCVNALKFNSIVTAVYFLVGNWG